MEAGSSVRTVAECVAEAARDVTVQTALARGATGLRGAATVRDCQRARDAALDARAFLRAKTLEMKQRHVKYEGTPYALEPNCKESPGGLRDLQVVIWVARAAGLGRTWRELAAKGLITPFEASQLVKHEGTLRAVRARLHMVAGRREDRLVFDLQTAVAESFGCHATKEQRAVRGADAPLLLGGQGGDAAQPDPDAEHRGAHHRVGSGADAADQRALPRPRRLARGGARRPLPGRPARHPGDLPRLPADAGAAGTFGAHLARAVQRAPGHEAGLSPRRRQSRHFHGHPAPAQRPDACAAADEPDLGAGALPVGLPPHRRAHAARPVPRLHRGPAHPDGGAQRAPLLHPRARPRIPVLQPAGGAMGPALAAVRGGDLPRRRQGPRRRPFRTRRARGSALLPRPRHRPRRRAA